MDERRNREDTQIIWDIFEGDLVKVKKYDIDGELHYESADPREQAKECLRRSIIAIPAI